MCETIGSRYQVKYQVYDDAANDDAANDDAANESPGSSVARADLKLRRYQ
jgi:hypothetical protein